MQCLGGPGAFSFTRCSDVFALRSTPFIDGEMLGARNPQPVLEANLGPWQTVILHRSFRWESLLGP